VVFGFGGFLGFLGFLGSFGPLLGRDIPSQRARIENDDLGTLLLFAG
jgi:hypothetical protein